MALMWPPQEWQVRVHAAEAEARALAARRGITLDGIRWVPDPLDGNYKAAYNLTLQSAGCSAKVTLSTECLHDSAKGIGAGLLRGKLEEAVMSLSGSLAETWMRGRVRFEGGLLDGRSGTRAEFDAVGILFREDGTAEYLPGSWGEGPHRVIPGIYVARPSQGDESDEAVYVFRGP